MFGWWDSFASAKFKCDLKILSEHVWRDYCKTSMWFSVTLNWILDINSYYTDHSVCAWVLCIIVKLIFLETPVEFLVCRCNAVKVHVWLCFILTCREKLRRFWFLCLSIYCLQTSALDIPCECNALTFWVHLVT